MDTNQIVYDRDFRIALYVGNGKPFPGFAEDKTCDVSDINTDATQQGGSGDQRVEVAYDPSVLDTVWSRVVAASKIELRLPDFSLATRSLEFRFSLAVIVANPFGKVLDDLAPNTFPLSAIYGGFQNIVRRIPRGALSCSGKITHVFFI